MAFQNTFLNGRLVLIACLVIQNLAKINCQLSSKSERKPPLAVEEKPMTSIVMSSNFNATSSKHDYSAPTPSTAPLLTNNTTYNTTTNSNWPVIEYVSDYNVGIRFLFEDNILMGECAISMHIQHALQTIKLNSVSIQIIDIFLFERKYGLIYKVSVFNNYNNILTINFTNEVPPATYILNIKYMRFINQSYTNFFVSLFEYQKNKAEQKLNQTGVEVMKAEQLFPFLESAFKSNFTINIKHHKRYTILSNMPIREQYKDDKNDIMWTYFDDILLLPQHLSIVITTFTNVSSHLANVTIWCREDVQQYIQYAINITEKIVPYFKQKYKSKLSKLDIVALRHSDGENDATFGLVLQREADIIYDKNLHSVVRKREVAHVIARQLAFLWCDDKVFWSKEGFAIFLGAHILDEVYPDTHMMNLMVVQAQEDSLRYDVSSVEYSPTLKSTNISEVSLESPPNYMKSFIIWCMINHMLGDTFWTSIHKYININHTNSNMATSDDLWTTMQETHNKTYPNHTHSIYFKEIVTDWITRKYYAVLKGTSDVISYICSDYLINNGKETIWIPLMYKSYLDTNFDSSRIYVIKIDAESHWTFDLLKEEERIINILLTGYYRVNYDIENWEELMYSLSFENFSYIHIFHRAQIIDDAFYFFLQRNLSFNLFWNLTNFVTRDTNFVTWYPMLKVFESLTCIYPLKYGKTVTNKIKNRIELLLTEIGYSERQNELELIVYLREEALKWACILRISQCRIMAISKFEKAFENSTEISNMQNMWIYCRTLLTLVNYTIWHEIRNKWIATSDRKYLEYLTCFQDSRIICNFLRMTIMEEIQSNDNIETNRPVSAFLSTIEKHAQNDKLYSCLFEIIKESIFALSSNRENDVIATLIVIITHVHGGNHLAKIEDEAINILKEARLLKAIQTKIKKRRLEYGRLISKYGNYFS